MEKQRTRHIRIIKKEGERRQNIGSRVPEKGACPLGGGGMVCLLAPGQRSLSSRRVERVTGKSGSFQVLETVACSSWSGGGFELAGRTRALKYGAKKQPGRGLMGYPVRQ